MLKSFKIGISCEMPRGVVSTVARVIWDHLDRVRIPAPRQKLKKRPLGLFFDICV